MLQRFDDDGVGIGATTDDFDGTDVVVEMINDGIIRGSGIYCENKKNAYAYIKSVQDFLLDDWIELYDKKFDSSNGNQL